jgi:hypothetical protein
VDHPGGPAVNDRGRASGGPPGTVEEGEPWKLEPRTTGPAPPDTRPARATPPGKAFLGSGSRSRARVPRTDPEDGTLPDELAAILAPLIDGAGPPTPAQAAELAAAYGEATAGLLAHAWDVCRAGGVRRPLAVLLARVRRREDDAWPAVIRAWMLAGQPRPGQERGEAGRWVAADADYAAWAREGEDHPRAVARQRERERLMGLGFDRDGGEPVPEAPDPEHGPGDPEDDRERKEDRW